MNDTPFPNLWDVFLCPVWFVDGHGYSVEFTDRGEACRWWYIVSAN